MSPSRRLPRVLRLLALTALLSSSLALAAVPSASSAAKAVTPRVPAHLAVAQSAPSKLAHAAVGKPRRAKAPIATTPTHPTPWLAGVVQAPLVGPVTLYGPPSNVPLRGLALFLSGDGGWNLGVVGMARRAANLGLWVAGFSTPEYLHALAARPAGTCSDAAGTLTTLATSLKQQLNLPADLPVLLIGYSSGATMVYAALVQAAPHAFQGGLSLGFGPEIETTHVFCPGAGDLAWQKSPHPPHMPSFVRNTDVSAPWHILQGEIDEDVAPQFATDYVAGVPGAKAWLLPYVGHGFGVPRNWAPQYRAALETLLPPSPAAVLARPAQPAKSVKSAVR